MVIPDLGGEAEDAHAVPRVNLRLAQRVEADVAVALHAAIVLVAEAVGLPPAGRPAVVGPAHPGVREAAVLVVPPLVLLVLVLLVLLEAGVLQAAEVAPAVPAGAARAPRAADAAAAVAVARVPRNGGRRVGGGPRVASVSEI